MMEGELTAVVQAGSYLLTPGNLMIINSKELHMTRANGSVCYILLQISAEHLHNFLPSGTELHFQTMIAPAPLPHRKRGPTGTWNVSHRSWTGYGTIFKNR